MIDAEFTSTFYPGGDPDGKAPGADDPPRNKKAPSPSSATVLVRLALKTYTFGVSTTGETYAKPRTGPKVIQMLRGSKTSLRNELARRYFLLKGGAASQQALADALMVLEGMAQEAEPQILYLRVARHGGALWLDLGDDTGRGVRIASDGWTIAPEAPVLFKRTALTAALPEPVMPADEEAVTAGMAELWTWLNVAKEDRPLVLAYLLAILHPDIPHPVLALDGEQGSGKSTALKVLVSLLDPSPVPLRKAPRDGESWVTAASGSWVVGLDNLSAMPDWLSDSLCRAVTGDGDVRRKLYTDGDMHVFAFRRCPIFNGIDIGAIRGDLADRMLSITLHVISEDKRRPEAGFEEAWKEAHPRILGSLLCGAAGLERLLPSVEIVRKPRMADFAKILAAVDQMQGTAGLARYLAKQSETAAESLTADEFISSLSGSIGSSFTGTAAELQRKVVKPERVSRQWPMDARAITALLMRQAPVMRKAGWSIAHDDARNHDKIRIWTIVPPPLHASNGAGYDAAGAGRGSAGQAGQKYGQSQGGENGTAEPEDEF